MTAIRITYGRRLALTTGQAAARYGLTLASMRKALSRLGVAPLPEALDGRTPLYPAAALDAAMRHRPGRGRRPAEGRPGHIRGTQGRVTVRDAEKR